MSNLAVAYAMKKKGRGGFDREEKASGYEDCPHCARGACMEHDMKMAEGGFIHEEKASGYDQFGRPKARHDMRAEHESEHEDEMDHEEDEHESLDMVDRIMRRRMAEGGRVANETMDEDDEFEPNEFDDMVKDDHMNAHYKDDEEIGDHQEDEDRQDVVERAMRQRRMKAGRYPKTGMPGYP